MPPNGTKLISRTSRWSRQRSTPPAEAAAPAHEAESDDTPHWQSRNYEGSFGAARTEVESEKLFDPKLLRSAFERIESEGLDPLPELDDDPPLEEAPTGTPAE